MVRLGHAVHDAGRVLLLGHTGEARVLPLRPGHPHLHSLHLPHSTVQSYAGSMLCMMMMACHCSYPDIIVHRLLAAAIGADDTYPDLLDKV